MKILLVCSMGISTSLLEKSIIEYCKSVDEDIEIVTMPSNEAKELLDKYDVVLLGPQVRFLETSFKQVANMKPIVVIPPQIYAVANGKECFELAKKAIAKNKC